MICPVNITDDDDDDERMRDKTKIYMNFDSMHMMTFGGLDISFN